MSYGKNFDFLVPPRGEHRRGRFFLDEAAAVPMGAPVLAAYTGGVTDAVNALDMEPVVLAAGAQDKPVNGRGGVLVYEYGPNAYAGFDTELTNYSDLDTAPPGAAVQVVHGDYVKVVLRNTVAFTFLESASYTGRVMVAGLSDATPTVAVGEFLTPATTPNDTNGYWAETATASEGWLVITKVDSARDELEAQFTF